MDTWKKTIQKIFNNRNISNDRQHVFSLEELKEIEIPNNELIIRSLNDERVSLRRLENHSFLEAKILRFWDSIDSFLNNGFGYYAELNNNVVSLCFSAFVADQTHAIDIETLKEYRGMNYGTAVARSIVQKFIREKVCPYWDCTPENTGSIRIARTIGLSPKFDYDIFWYHLS